MPTQLRVEIVTQSGVQYTGIVDSVVVPAIDGYIGVHIGHAPLLSNIGVGIVTLHTVAGDDLFAVAGGVVEVHDDQVTLLADAAEPAAAIDVSRANAAVERARKRLGLRYEGAGQSVDVDHDRARAALARAINRLQTAEKAGLLG